LFYKGALITDFEDHFSTSVWLTCLESFGCCGVKRTLVGRCGAGGGQDKGLLVDAIGGKI